MRCPKCSRELKASGVMNHDGQELAVYQCDECLVPWAMDGESIDVALTFAVRPDGVLVDPANPSEAISLN